ncbi:hypothetical protein LCGC14_1854340 [marine sediment metagenome]|uniref:Uncharacterized protein n=1 Tax=marine sediment metagenome TaxID=412755 RepID=A0A0F9J8L6_9ZZZZ
MGRRGSKHAHDFLAAVKEAMEKTAPIFEKLKKAMDGNGPRIVEV